MQLFWAPTRHHELDGPYRPGVHAPQYLERNTFRTINFHFKDFPPMKRMQPENYGYGMSFLSSGHEVEIDYLCLMCENLPSFLSATALSFLPVSLAEGQAAKPSPLVRPNRSLRFVPSCRYKVELPKVSVREIQVKQVDRNIAHLSVNHDAASVGGNGGEPRFFPSSGCIR